MFKIGEKVVCIYSFIADKIDVEVGNIMPVKGEIYTIRSIEIHKEGIGFRLEEIVNGVYKYQNTVGELCFNAIRFRKLDYDFAENLLENIKKEVQSECQINQKPYNYV